MKTWNGKKGWLLLCSMILVLSLSSCIYKEMSRNRTNLSKIRKGMTKKQVLQIMGEPVKNEIYCSPNVWYYCTQQVWMDGLTTRDECTPIAFDANDQVIGWGNEYQTGIYSYRNVEIPTSRKKE